MSADSGVLNSGLPCHAESFREFAYFRPDSRAG
jgi:hypothetical protein